MDWWFAYTTLSRAAVADSGFPAGRITVLDNSVDTSELALQIAAAHRIRERVPDFQLVIVGDGPQRELVRRAAAEADGWVHWLGARAGRDKARVLAISQLMLNPGMVGLSILDALVAAGPMVTTTYPYHSPEIAYLESGRNGLITAGDVEAFAEGVVRLIEAPGQLACLQAGCRALHDRAHGGQFLRRHPEVPEHAGKGKNVAWWVRTLFARGRSE